jgi:hypothetical protein
MKPPRGIGGGMWLRGGCAAAAGAMLYVLAVRLFPAGPIGPDYDYFLPYLLAGEQWIHSNGWLAPPYFTPAFCGGLPWLANPQSMVWSLPQLLFNVLGPTGALRGTLVVCAGAGAAGTYMLLRRGFAASRDAATLGAILFLLNGFLMFRLAAGHLTFHAFAVTPLLTALCLPRARQAPDRYWLRGAVACVLGALLLSLAVFAGALNIMVPIVLCPAIVILLRQVATGLRLRPWIILGGACLVAVPMSAIKLAPALVWVLQNPRHYLASGLFSGFLRMGYALFLGLFAPSALPDKIWLGPHRVTLMLQELEYGVTAVPLLLLIAAVVKLARARLKDISPGQLTQPSDKARLPVNNTGGVSNPLRSEPGIIRSKAALLLLAVALCIPVALSVGPEWWSRFLQTVPVINNNSVLIRFWSVYILPLIVTAGLAMDLVAGTARARHWVLAAATLLVLLQCGTRDLGFYTTARYHLPYQSAPVAAAHARLVAGEGLPGIATLGAAEVGIGPRPNDGLLRGISPLACYEAIFGYALETFPAGALPIGRIERQPDGRFNLADPRCYLDTGKNACRPGQPFAGDDAAAVEAFVNYRPLPWRMPVWQRVAALTSLVTLGLSAIVLVAAAMFSFMPPSPKVRTPRRLRHP